MAFHFQLLSFRVVFQWFIRWDRLKLETIIRQLKYLLHKGGSIQENLSLRLKPLEIQKENDPIHNRTIKREKILAKPSW